ncbi:hypothetical protein KDI_23290 [Dictyobacter arantiisoli]|uniref:site-specific DNA-methyltransferase (adenine-specific) n=1 Tax=Dictyobacter arantiisoli TaxID=2014874 RepID=A0A5A5TC30_9CHLR|nr:hypothetical protein KDI_23290 [Dictyobacter arantiisoli]
MLFQSGSPHSAVMLERALALFEAIDLPDMCVWQLLDLIHRALFLRRPLMDENDRDAPQRDLEMLCPEYLGLIYQTLLDCHQHGAERKGSGTFYTRPQLAQALARRTLEPLTCMLDEQGQSIPCPPADILALHICDPACGSASFLLAALRYLCTRLTASLLYYTCEDAEQPIQTDLRLQIAAQCLYGVDLAPLVVELAQISLWLEIGVDYLPLHYLNTHIKVGNALLGAWYQNYCVYPWMAWMRAGGDSNHTTSIHYPEGAWTRALRQMRDTVIKPELASVLPQSIDIQSSDLKYAFDSWCAIWFWPADQLAHVPTPASFYRQDTPTQQTRQIVDTLTTQLRFFHWPLVFPEIYQDAHSGFDAILTNPPWETSKPGSREFFSDYDPCYRQYGKQEALARQRLLFAQDHMLEYSWLSQQAEFKNIRNWFKYAGSPAGKPVLTEDATPLPFRYQGAGELNTYKLFLEQAHYLLKPHGYLGMLVPASIYTDQGALALRKLFLYHCKWIVLLGFINRRGLFDIHRSFRFAALLVEKGGSTEQLQVAFQQVDLQVFDDYEQNLLRLSRQHIERFSPTSLSLIEAQSPHDIALLEKLATDTVLLGAQSLDSWQIRYAREFDMTTDSHLFAPLPDWHGYQSDLYGRWRHGDKDFALPVYEGRMIGAFDPSAKGWLSGKGRSAVWNVIPWTAKQFAPQYLMSLPTYRACNSAIAGHKIGIMDICSAINARSMYATFIHGNPCGNVVPVIQPSKQDIVTVLSLLANLNSFVYDYMVRYRLGGQHLNYFVLAETPVIPPVHICPTLCAQLAARLNLAMVCFAPQWLELRTCYPTLGKLHWRRLWAITPHERLRLRCILDALVANLYGLTYDELAWILRPDRHQLYGFWRVDKERPVVLRHTTLTLQAYAHLQRVGRAAFEQEDWQFPPAIAAQLGPRFTSWQQEGSIHESWAECEAHARAIPIPLPS